MVDYKDIGARIRKARQDQDITQEQLAEMVGVGTAHISHIETGSGTPGFSTILNIINTLGCSADEILCIEVAKARPVFNQRASEMFSDCSQDELKLITSVILSMKENMRRLKTFEKPEE